MSPADFQDKKRKRSSRSPVPAARASFKMAAKVTHIDQVTPDIRAGDFKFEQTNSNAEEDKAAIAEEVMAEEVKAAKDAFARAQRADQEFREYEGKRSDLLKAEKEKAWDRKAEDNASDSEKQAGAIIRAIREYERDAVFGSIPREELPDKDSLDMGGQFLTNKDRIEQRSKVYEIAKEVPKGAILHLHFNAELHPKLLLQEARRNEHLRIRSIRPILTENDLEETEMVITVKPAECHRANIFDPNYKGTTPNSHKDKDIEPLVWMRYSEFRKIFNKRYGKKPRASAVKLPSSEPLPNCGEQGPITLEPAEEWLLEKMILSEKEAYDPSQTTNGYVSSVAFRNITF